MLACWWSPKVWAFLLFAILIRCSSHFDKLPHFAKLPSDSRFITSSMCFLCILMLHCWWLLSSSRRSWWATGGSWLILEFMDICHGDSLTNENLRQVFRDAIKHHHRQPGNLRRLISFISISFWDWWFIYHSWVKWVHWIFFGEIYVVLMRLISDLSANKLQLVLTGNDSIIRFNLWLYVCWANFISIHVQIVDRLMAHI